jgi:hypothetical protein
MIETNGGFLATAIPASLSEIDFSPSQGYI